MHRLLSLCLAVLLLAGCREKNPADAPAIAVASSYLECAVRDLLGEGAGILRLAEPGMCPGHFDIRPSQVEQLRRCRVLLRFEFQSSLDRQAGGIDGITIAPLKIAGGMCEPESYLRACEQSAAALVGAGLLPQADADAHLAAVRERVGKNARAMQDRIAAAGLRGTAVICSGHQAAFCRWMGLNVIATFGGADGESIRRVDQAVALAKQAGCTLVIANRPEGAQLAEAIAERLGGKLAIFDNFPDLSERQRSHDDMIQGNLDRLLAAAGKP